MIIINRKPSLFNKKPGISENSIYYVTGMFNWNILSHPNIFHPPTDVLETDDKLIVRIEIAGLESDNFSINFDQHILSIDGNRRDLLSKRAFHQMEVPFGEFSSVIEINIPIFLDGIIAEYLDGFLTIEMPKLKPTTIPVEDEN